MSKKSDEKSLLPVPISSVKELANSDLVNLARELLQAIVSSTNMLHVRNMTVEKLKEARLVLGFLNACNATMKTKIQVFKMVGVGAKIQAISKKSKRFALTGKKVK